MLLQMDTSIAVGGGSLPMNGFRIDHQHHLHHRHQQQQQNGGVQVVAAMTSSLMSQTVAMS